MSNLDIAMRINREARMSFSLTNRCPSIHGILFSNIPRTDIDILNAPSTEQAMLIRVGHLVASSDMFVSLLECNVLGLNLRKKRSVRPIIEAKQ